MDSFETTQGIRDKEGESDEESCMKELRDKGRSGMDDVGPLDSVVLEQPLLTRKKRDSS